MEDTSLQIKCFAAFCALDGQLKSKNYSAAYSTACTLIEMLTTDITAKDATLEWAEDLYRLPYLIESAAQHNHARSNEYGQVAELFERAADSLGQAQQYDSFDRIENAHVALLVHAFRCWIKAKDKENAARLHAKAMEAAVCLKEQNRLLCWLEYSILCTEQLDNAEENAVAMAEMAYEAATNALILQWRTPMGPRCCFQQEIAARHVWMMCRKELPFLQQIKWLVRLLTAEVCGWILGLFD